jgi:hypothetical protein
MIWLFGCGWRLKAIQKSPSSPGIANDFTLVTELGAKESSSNKEKKGFFDMNSFESNMLTQPSKEQRWKEETL